MKYFFLMFTQILKSNTPGIVLGDESVFPCNKDPKINQNDSRTVKLGEFCASICLSVFLLGRFHVALFSSMHRTIETTTKDPSVHIQTIGDNGLRNCNMQIDYSHELIKD